jgi:hypothetical protein
VSSWSRILECRAAARAAFVVALFAAGLAVFVIARMGPVTQFWWAFSR